MKACSACGCLSDNFGPDKRRPNGLQSQCRPCMQKGKKKSYQKHKLEVLKKAAKYRDEHREEIKTYFNEYNQKRHLYLKHHYEIKRDFYSKKFKKWRLANSDKRKLSSKKRSDYEKLCTPKWLTNLHKQQIKSFQEAVDILNEQSKTKFVVDHIIPFQGKNISGLHVPWNLQVLFAKENHSKKNKFDGTYKNKGWINDFT